VSEIAREALSPNASEQDKESVEVEALTADLTDEEAVRVVFEKYGKGGVWGVIHVAV
jgi:short-subunit dehydrogenase